jgi:aspartate/methionine/tyrosine aminotransferase
MIDVSAVAQNGIEFAEKLLESESVSVLPGIGFGQCCSEYVRVSLAQPISVLTPAFDRIERFLSS